MLAFGINLLCYKCITVCYYCTTCTVYIYTEKRLYIRNTIYVLTNIYSTPLATFVQVAATGHFQTVQDVPLRVTSLTISFAAIFLMGFPGVPGWSQEVTQVFANHGE